MSVCMTLQNVCKKYGIPTAAYETFTDPSAAKEYICSHGAPIVVKTSGLAAGKGVTVAMSVDEALQAVDAMMVEKVYGEAGSKIVIEDFLRGEEASFFALCDGQRGVKFMSAQDHKAAFDGDKGPNTGGMGAYSPAPVVTPEVEQKVMDRIVTPLVTGMAKDGHPYRGVLFVGLMIEDGEPNLIEFNVRFGDPECQVMMSRLESDLTQVLKLACESRLDEIQVKVKPDTSLTVVMAAKGYPGNYQKGTVIKGLEQIPRGAKVFHAGTTTNEKGEIVAAGGRVLNVTGTGKDAREAQKNAYAAVDAIQWDDGFCRRDIGYRAVQRL